METYTFWYLWSQLFKSWIVLSTWSQLFKRWIALSIRPGLLEAWLVLTSVKYHGNLYILVPLNQRLVLNQASSNRPQINHYPVVNTINFRNTYLEHWIVIYPVDSAIQRLNNWGQIAIHRISIRETDCTIQWIVVFILWISSRKTNCIIHWIVIYPVDSAIPLLNN